MPAPFRFFRSPVLVLVAGLVFLIGLAGCSEQERSVVRPESTAASLSQREPAATKKAQNFAAILDSLNYNNEILIVLKDRDVAVVSPDYAGSGQPELPSGRAAIAFPAVPEDAPRRKAEGFAPSGVNARHEVHSLLSAQSIDPKWEGQVFPVIHASLPEAKTEGILKKLFLSPYVDYVEAVHPVVVDFSALPVGTNATDDKHQVHDVKKAWDHTRGDGAKIGIMDSGLAGSVGNWHPDAQFEPQGHGVYALGYVNYSGDCCENRDDHGHGTWMTGLVGANDNDLGGVGIAPYAKTFSMKVTYNCKVVDWLYCDDKFVVDDAGMVGAIDYGGANGFDVLSMSFVVATSIFDGWDGSAVEDALYEAYHAHDILLLAAAGNPGSEGQQWLVEKPYVMGVGGMRNDSTNYGLNEHEEVSALSGGSTTDTECPGDDFCEPHGTGFFPAPNGGTSASTANVAAIAGLVRSYYPYKSAPTVRNRLRGTANQHNSVVLVNAYEAIVNNPPVPRIVGPSTPPENSVETWSADIRSGFPPFSYQWHRNGVLVSEEDSYTGDTGCDEFELKLTVTDAEDRTRWTTKTVTPDGDEVGTIACPE